MNINDINQLKQNYKNQKMTKEQVMQMKKAIENAKTETRKSSSGNVVKFAVPFAAAIALFIAVPNVSMQAAETLSSVPVIGKLVEAVTFRDYHVETETKLADVKVPEVVVTDAEVPEVVADANATLSETTEEINAEIETLTQKFIDEFEANMTGEGYQELVINHETIQSNDLYFTLKLTCYEAAASGAEWNYYYTIDLATGERLALKELFIDNADYITPISENIKSQMAQQMAADENIIYWLDDPEMPEWNFNTITEDTEFFLNDTGNIVISFNEGDVAPMYMGVCTFEIPDEIVKDIRK
ncbi:MAG: DUF3298 domain-containing protein [Lachnospiraceae bacterium]|nr:DUF3298 domain-containing protein [Lachnospiraceae bacterium]